MAYLYVSTDEDEVKELLGVSRKRDYYASIKKYHKMNIKDGERLEQRVGFNPMLSIEFDERVSDDFITIIALRLIKHDLFVAVESKGEVRKYGLLNGW